MASEQRISIALGGIQYHTRTIARTLKTIDELDVSIVDESSLCSMNHVDVLYWIYGPGPSIRKELRLWIQKRPHMIIHWIGSDVSSMIGLSKRDMTKTWLASLATRNLNNCRRGLGNLTNLAGAPWLVDELQSIGIKAEEMMLTTIPRNCNQADVSFEKEFDFISYAPYSRFDFYGGRFVHALAEKNPDRKFLVIMPGLTEMQNKPSIGALENVTLLPEVDRQEMAAYYEKSKCLLRPIEHDGLSLSVLEALSHGLSVVWTYPFPFTTRISVLDENAETRTLNTVENWTPNIEGRSYVLEHFSEEAWIIKFFRVLREAAIA
ncbi:MAG: glycosyltransferase [Methanobacteriota archaeon]|nr:MAG: glycosyltransferase [Euryarchaeota archaeon]